MDDSSLTVKQTSEVERAAGDGVDASRWPLWARVLIGRIEAGDDVEEARNREGSKVSLAIIQRAQRELPGFATAFDTVRVGQRVLGADVLRENARAYGVAILADAYAESRGLDPATGELATTTIYDKDGKEVGQRETILPRDRLGNRRFIGEAGDMFPQRGVTAAVTVNVGVNVITSQDEQQRRVDTVEGVVVKRDAMYSDDAGTRDS